ncbi:MAG: divalent metal cation transporter [bacterium]
MQQKTFWEKVRGAWKSVGPGFITGAADDDPSGIATYSQTGAMFGYSQLWTALFSLPFMIAVQEMCGRIGMVTGKGLSQIICEEYSKKILFFAVLLLLVANTINIGADLGAMAAAVQLLVPTAPFVLLLIVITLFTLLLEIFVSYKNYAKFLKYLTLSLLAYVATAFVVHQDWSLVLRSTFIPHIALTQSYLMNIAAILGTTISPYLFFWQTDEEVEEEVESGKLLDMNDPAQPAITTVEIKAMQRDTTVGMVFSQLVMFFIILSVAATLSFGGTHMIATAADAARALQPVAGNFAFLLFTLGILGTGLLAVPVLAGSAGYAVAEAFGWKEGLGRKYADAHGFYGIIALATLVGFFVNFTGLGAMTMLYYAAILNGLLAPPLIIIILYIGNNKKILGEHTNSKRSNILGVIVAAVMSAIALALLWSLV